MFSANVAAGYNDYDPRCGTWTNANPVGIQWKWDADINTGGWWAYAFASVGEPTWDNSYAKIDLGYNTAAEGEYGVYNTADGWSGATYTWCHVFTTRIEDFLAEGNLNWHGDSSWDSYMGQTAGHEIGHTLGYGHSNYDAIMKQGYTGSWPTSDDNSGMSAMYP